MRMVRVAVISVTAGLFLSCEGSEFFSGPLTSESCSTGGRTYSGNVQSGTWRRGASPHVLVDSVVVDSTLTIEPGSLVCGMPGSTLTVAGLEAVGTEDSPIVFTSDDPDGWGGLRGRGLLRNARIERTVFAVRGPFEIDRSVILRTRSWAVTPWWHGDGQQVILRDVVIDSACTAGGCGAVLVQPFSGATLEDVVIRWSGGDGILAGYEYCGLTIDGGSIEGSAGVGLRMVVLKPFRACGFSLIEPVRITGGAEHPAIVTAGAALHFLRDAETQAALAGNALDELIVTGDHDFGDADLTLTRQLPVSVGFSCGHFRGALVRLGMITMEPGASLALFSCDFGVHLRANGTAEEPVTIRGGAARLHTIAGHADTAYLRHVVFRDHIVLRADSAPVILEDITLHDSSFELVAAGSRIDGIDAVRSNGIRPYGFGPGPDPWPTLILHSGTSLRNAHIEQSLGDGIVVDGDDVSIDGCTITTSAQHGIRVLAGAPVVRSCNIVANAGDGIHNAGSGQVDAVLNWWGDAMGPLGPDGDGVHGNILYDPFLAGPAAGAGGGKDADRNLLTRRR